MLGGMGACCVPLPVGYAAMEWCELSALHQSQKTKTCLPCNLCCRIVTGVLVGVMGVARIVTSMGRTHLFFPIFGVISPRFQTPMWATLFVTVAGVPLAILTDLPPLIDCVSAGRAARPKS